MANSNYSIDVTPSVDTPDRTITVDGEDYPVSAVGRVVPGDDLTVSVTAPSNEDYQIQLRNSEEQIRRASDTDLEGDATVTFDTGEIENHPALDPKSYAAAAVDSGTVENLHPVVVIGYRIDVEIPRIAEAGESFEATATVSPIASVDSVPPIQEVELVVWDADTTDRILMSGQGDMTYQATTSKTAGEYKAAVIVKSDEPLGENDYEPVGFSDPNPVTVEASTDLLSPTWSVTTEGRMQFSAPAVTSSRVFHGSLGSRFEARDRASNGDLIWSHDRAGALSDASPVLDSGTLYVGSGGGVLYALDATTDTSQIIWEQPFGSAITSTAAVANGTVFVGTNDGQVHALDATDGGVQWSRSVSGPVYSTLDASTEAVYLTTVDGDVLALNHDGSTAWTLSTSVRLGAGSPVYDSGTLYVAAESFLALDATSGSVDWEYTGYGGTAGSTPAVDGDSIYVGDETGTVHALDGASAGSPLWQFEVGAGVASRPAVVGSNLVVAVLDGTMFVLDPATGDWLDSAVHDAAVRAPLVAADGDVFVGTENEALAAYRNLG